MSRRSIVASAALACVVAVLLHAALYSPISPQPLSLHSSHFPPNDALQRVERLGEGRLEAPEAVMVDAKAGMLYTATRDGWIKRMHISNEVWEDWKFVGGPTLLGITNSISGGLIVCDTEKGLLKVGEEGVTTLTSEVAGTKIGFADDVIEATDGSIYFSDASTRFSLHNVVLDFLEARPHGRLLKYDPSTNKTSILLAELAFANGVTLSSDEDYVVVCETWKFRCLKHWLKGAREGGTEVLIDNLPGGPDNINLAPDGSFWIALLQYKSAGLDWIHGSSLVKRIIASFPKVAQMTMHERTRAMVIKLTPDGKITQMLDDSNGSVINFVTSAVEFEGNLYLGSLEANFVGKLPLNQSGFQVSS